MSVPSVIVISVDGLRASALGAYGNTWFGTPAIDHLAAGATVFSRCYAQHAALPAVWSGLLGPIGEGREGSLFSAFTQPGCQSLLLTDDGQIAGHQASERFGEVVPTTPPEPHRPAASASEITSAATLSALVDAIEEQRSVGPMLAWAHLRFASGPWDAPLNLVDELLDEEDPRPAPSVSPPDFHLADDEHDDARFLATLRYAAQVIALDSCLGVVFAALEEMLGRQAFTLAVVGTRGYALGEHGAVGNDPRPYNECRQAPVIIRRAGDPQHRRRGELLAISDVTRLLLDPSAALGREQIVLSSPLGAALQNEHWKLFRPTEGEPELYSKPDDIWEMNDFAVREPHLVEQLEEELAEQLAEGLKASSAAPTTPQR